jgi:hypothetical protein
MTIVRCSLPPLLLVLAGMVTLAAEFSVEKIHQYASNVRVSQEAKEYIDGLPPEAIVRIADQLDFSKDGRGKNAFFFSFTCRKASQLQSEGIRFDEDYVFGKLTDFVREAIKKGDVGRGSGAMISLADYDHPKVIELAQELQGSEDEFTRDSATRVLESHARRLRVRERERKAGESERLGAMRQSSAESGRGQIPENGDSELKSQSGFLRWILGGVLIVSIVVLLIRALAGRFSD